MAKKLGRAPLRNDGVLIPEGRPGAKPKPSKPRRVDRDCGIYIDHEFLAEDGVAFVGRDFADGSGEEAKAVFDLAVALARIKAMSAAEAKGQPEGGRIALQATAVGVLVEAVAANLPGDEASRTVVALAIRLGEQAERLRVMTREAPALAGKKTLAGSRRGGQAKAYTEEMTADLRRICQAAVDAEMARDRFAKFTAASERAAKYLRYPEREYPDGKRFPNAGRLIDPKTIRRHSTNPKAPRRK